MIRPTHIEHLEARFARRLSAHLAAHMAAPLAAPLCARPPHAVPGASASPAVEGDPLGLSHEVRERLKGARQVALARRKAPAKAVQVAVAPAAWSVLPGRDGSASLGRFDALGRDDEAGPHSSRMWSMLGQWLPALALVLTLVGLSEWQQHSQLSDLAELDIAVLADELPPQAYADPGFAQFLKAQAEHDEHGEPDQHGEPDVAGQSKAEASSAAATQAP